MIDCIDKYIGIGESLVTILAIIIGGIWTYTNFIQQRQNKALIDFTVDVVFHHFQQGYWIVELVAIIENKGKVQHRIYDFKYDLASIDNDQDVTINPTFGNQVNFPNIISEGSFLPKEYGYFFNEPGLKNKYSFLARVPESSSLIILHSWFTYSDGKHSHSAECTKKVPNKPES